MSENTDYLLSICIPTYNRGDFLKETLESIVTQATNDIEVVILDSGSTDNTSKIVQDYQQRFPGIKYYYSSKKKGIDIDLAKTVDYAHGKYCWLLSSDDALAKNAINILFAVLESNYEIYICTDVICDYYLKPIKSRSLLRKTEKTDFKLFLREDLLSYLRNCTGLSPIFSYMSILIFKITEWKKTLYDDNFTGTGYAHITRIFDIINNNGKLRIIKDALVLNRSFNDSFLEMGVVRRFLLDIDGYIKLSDRFFPNDLILKKHFLKIMLLEHPWYRIIKLRSFVEDPETWRNIKEKLLFCGYTKSSLYICCFLAKSRKLVNLAIKLRHRYNKAGFHKYIYSIKNISRK